MTAKTVHRLDGLEPDNLLAFLALLGLLRALELKNPEWRPRAYWDVERAPLRPILTTRKQTTWEDLSRSALDGLLIFKDALKPFSLPGSEQVSVNKDSFWLSADKSHRRKLSERCFSGLAACHPNRREFFVWQLRCDLLACLGASRVDRKKGDVFDTTPMKLPSGQMKFIGAQFDLICDCKVESINNSLFKPWTYSYKKKSLRLSPEDARRYAYRASDPSPEGSRTELGASALNGLGLLAFPMSQARPNWRMVAYTGTRTEGKISWPIWSTSGGKGASLCTIMAMLRAITFKDNPGTSASNLIHMIATARRYVLDPKQGDYGNVTRAKFSFPSENS